MERITMIIGIIVSTGGVIRAIFRAISLLGQTSVSITLMTHEERERHRLAQSLVFYVGLFAISFGIGMIFSFELFSLKPIADRVGVEFMSGISIIIASMLALIVLLRLIHNDKKNKSVQTLIKYLGVFALLLLCFFLTFENMIFSGLQPNSLENNLIISVGVTIFSWMLMQLRGIGSEDEVAYLMVQYEDESLFLFEASGEYIVAGDKQCFKECNYYKLIKLADLNESLMNVVKEKNR